MEGEWKRHIREVAKVELDDSGWKSRGQSTTKENEEDVQYVQLLSWLMTSPLLWRSVLSSRVEERRVTEMWEGSPLHNEIIQTHSTLLFLPFPLVPSISSLHLPDSRSSSSLCRRSYLFSLDMAFYLRSNSHHLIETKSHYCVLMFLPGCLRVCVCLFPIGRVYLHTWHSAVWICLMFSFI